MPKVKPYQPGQGSRHGTKAEQKLAARLGAKLTPASGAAHHGAKADFTVGNMRGESKSTLKDSLSIKYEWLRKVEQEAVEQGQYPTLTLQFVTPDGRPRPGGSWICVPEYVFKELTDEVHKKDH